MAFYPFTATSSGGGNVIQAWQFTPESQGGKGDGIVVTDGAITSGGHNLTCGTSKPFTSTAVDGGKPIIVAGAGAAGGYLLTTIASVSSTSVAVLTAAASTTVSASGVIFGSDNTAAIKAAISAAVTYAQAHKQYAEVLFGSNMYCVSGSATIGGTTKTNAIFPMPIVDPTASAKVTLSFRGQCDTPDALLHWMQPTIQAAGPTVAVLNQSGTNDGTNGPAFVFAGPYAGYGGEPGLYNNMCMVVDGLTVLCPFNGTYGGWGFFGTAQARIISGSYQTMAIVPSGGAWPQLNPNNISNQWTYGAQMPSAGNNDLSDVTYWSAYGATYGYMPSEHSTALSVRCNYNIIGVEGYAGNGVNMNHGGRIYYASVEANLQGMGFLDGAVRLDVDTLDGEANTNIVYDPINRGIGTIGMRGNAGGYTGGGIVNGGSAITMIQQDMPTGAVTSPQGPPATTAGWLNAYYRPALINLAISGGTLSALTITGPGGAVAQSIPAACTLYFFCVPAGQTYTPTYTGTAAHTVTLI